MPTAEAKTSYTAFGRIADYASAVFMRESPRNLFWSDYKPANFGDWVGPYLFEKFTGFKPTFRRPAGRNFETTYVTVGSIVRHIKSENAIVWGAGVISVTDQFVRPLRVCAVRGPKTRDRFLELGYDCPEIYGDPAILLPAVFRPSVQRKTHILGLVPHFVDYEEAQSTYGTDCDFRVIDVTKPLESVVSEICSCEFVASSSLHGIIVANSYQIPAAQVTFGEKLHGDGIKFVDYYAAGGVSKLEKPLSLSGKVPRDEIVSYVESTEQPQLGPLLVPLLQACPFKSNLFGK